jgi:single-stranded-DNA-specific exonuclease
MTRELHGRLQHAEAIPPVIVCGNPDWRPALVGLAANKLAEEYSRPVFVWGRDGNGVHKGSCRAGGFVSVVALMNEVSTLFVEYGGHHASGGFSLKDDAVWDLGRALNEAYERIGTAAVYEETVHIDAVLTLDDVTPALVAELETLAPFGVGNGKPLFAFKNIVPKTVEQFGKGKEHLKVVYDTLFGTIEAIAFFMNAATCTVPPTRGQPSTLLAHIEQSFFMNRPQIRLRLVDCVPNDLV